MRTKLPLDKKVILFASQRIDNVNKGISYLIDACHKMVAENPEMRDEVVVAVLGGHGEGLQELFDFKVYELGYVNDTRQIVDIYNATDVFVLPHFRRIYPILSWRQWHVVCLV